MVFCWGGGLLVVALVLHLAIWKIRLPGNQLSALLKILLCVYAGWVLVFLVLPKVVIAGSGKPLSFKTGMRASQPIFLFLSLIPLARRGAAAPLWSRARRFVLCRTI